MTIRYSTIDIISVSAGILIAIFWVTILYSTLNSFQKISGSSSSSCTVIERGDRMCVD